MMTQCRSMEGISYPMNSRERGLSTINHEEPDTNPEKHFDETRRLGDMNYLHVKRNKISQARSDYYGKKRKIFNCSELRPTR